MIDLLPVLRSRQRQDNVLFYGGLAVFLILLYGGAIFLQSVSIGGRPLEAATDIAIPVLIGVFVGRKFGMERGLLVGLILAALAQIGSRK